MLNSKKPINELLAWDKLSPTKTQRNTSSDSAPRFRLKKPEETSKIRKIIFPTSKTDLKPDLTKPINNTHCPHIDLSVIENKNKSEGLHIPLERIPSYGIMLNDLTPVKTQSVTKVLEVFIPDLSPIANSKAIRTKEDDRTKIILQTLEGSQPGTYMTRSRSPATTQHRRYHLSRGNTTFRMRTGNSTTKNDETPQNATSASRTPERSAVKVPLNARDKKISQILQEVRTRINPNEKRRTVRESDDDPFQLVKNKRYNWNNGINSAINHTSKDRDFKVAFADEQRSHLKLTDISQKLDYYCNIFKSQLTDLKKARAPLHLKTRSLTDKPNLVSTKYPSQLTTKDKRTMRFKKPEVALKFAKAIKAVLRKLTLMNLTVEEIVTKKVFTNAPYQREGSREFIDAVKAGNFLETQSILFTNIYHVFDYDLRKQTALHWAAKRGFTMIMRLLLDKGADPDATDISGRTPLFLAAKAGCLNGVKLLLYFGANPMIKSEGEKLALHYAIDKTIRGLIVKSHKIHFRWGVYSHKKFKEKWDALDKRDFEVRRDQLV